MPNFLKILLFMDSRKVAFGLWLFIVSDWFLFVKLIDADKWLLCIGLSSGLIGGGTLADRWLKGKNGNESKPEAAKPA